MSERFTIIHIPHSAMEIPADLFGDYLVPIEQLGVELLNMTDHYTEELFRTDSPHVDIICFSVSRLVVDPERFVDDEREGMAKIGMGAVYSRTSDLKPLRKIDIEQKERLIERFYRPHHRRLNELCRKAIERSGKCLIIDGHSFPSVPLPYELDQSPDRPDICIGTDQFHTPDWLRHFALELFTLPGFSVEINRPFSGTMVPSYYYRRDKCVMSIMIEIRRGLYMDEATGGKLETFQSFKDMVNSMMGKIAAAGRQ